MGFLTGCIATTCYSYETNGRSALKSATDELTQSKPAADSGRHCTDTLYEARLEDTERFIIYDLAIAGTF